MPIPIRKIAVASGSILVTGLYRALVKEVLNSSNMPTPAGWGLIVLMLGLIILNTYSVIKDQKAADKKLLDLEEFNTNVSKQLEAIQASIKEAGLDYNPQSRKITKHSESITNSGNITAGYILNGGSGHSISGGTIVGQTYGIYIGDPKDMPEPDSNTPKSTLVGANMLGAIKDKFDKNEVDDTTIYLQVVEGSNADTGKLEIKALLTKAGYKSKFIDPVPRQTNIRGQNFILIDDRTITLILSEVFLN
jgi:hypothetical protein